MKKLTNSFLLFLFIFLTGCPLQEDNGEGYNGEIENTLQNDPSSQPVMFDIGYFHFDESYDCSGTRGENYVFINPLRSLYFSRPCEPLGFTMYDSESVSIEMGDLSLLIFDEKLFTFGGATSIQDNYATLYCESDNREIVIQNDSEGLFRQNDQLTTLSVDRIEDDEIFFQNGSTLEYDSNQVIFTDENGIEEDLNCVN